jgi:1,4-dihydroxy-2-naphthoate octaprenyltransferase
MFNQYISKIKFVRFLLIALTYSLGIGIVYYLRIPLKWDIFLDGLIWTELIYLSSIYFKVYVDRNNPSRYFPVEKEIDRPLWVKNEKALEKIYLLTGVTSLAVSIIPLFNFINKGLNNSIISIIVAMTLGVVFISEVFSEQLSTIGLSEFLQSFFFANLIPALAFILQSGIMHRLVFLLTFPLFFLFFALSIVLLLPDIDKNDYIYQNSLAARIGSPNIMRLHNILILFAFLVLLLETIFNLPWKLIWPALIALPIGLIQVWQVNQIERGKRPHLNALVFNAFATAGLTTYFMLLAVLLN